MNNDKVREEKLQYDIDSETAKKSVLSSCKIDKYEYLAGEEIFNSDPSQIIQKAKFTYSLLGKAYEEQTEKQVDALKSLTVLKKIGELK